MNPLLSGGLLAASMLLGQTPDPPTLSPLGAGKAGVKDATPTPLPIVQTQAQTTQPAAQRPVANWFSRDDRPIITKIQGWFKRDPQTPPNPQQPPFIQPTSSPKVRDVSPPITQPTTPTAPNDFPRKLPNPSTQQGLLQKHSLAKESSKSVQQTTLQQAAPATNTKSPILPQWAEKIGRDEKFEWVTGQIELESGNYVVYYASPETIDKYNGRLVLVPQTVDMKTFRRGDLVSLRGQLGQRQGLQGATPTYRLTDANLIERPKS